MCNVEFVFLGEQEIQVIVFFNLVENIIWQEDGLVEYLWAIFKVLGIMMWVEVDKSSVLEFLFKFKCLMISKEKYLEMREINFLFQEM